MPQLFRPIRRIRVHMLAAALLACAMLPDARAALDLKVHADIKRVANEGVKNIPPDETRDMEVILADSFIETSTADTATIYDFARRRRLDIDKRRKSYVDYSLYDVVGFRVMEMQNRQALSQALAAAKLDGRLADGVDNEHVLSIQASMNSTLDIATEGGDTVLKRDGRTLARVATGGFSANEKDVDRFAQFLRYVFGGHPSVLKSIVSGKRIPEHLTYLSRDVWGKTTTVLTVEKVSTVERNAYDLHEYTARATPDSGDELDALLDKEWNAVSMSDAYAYKKLNADLAKAFGERRPLDAMLAAIEFTLSTGKPLLPFSTEQQSVLQSDPAVRKLSSVMSANTRDGLVTALKVIDEVRPQARYKDYVLKIFEANDRASLGDIVAAKKLFVDVLHANPRLAGVYKDLGDVLARGYDFARAWRCWDIGRRIAPQFRNFTDVMRFEQQLAATHPEYF